MATITDPIYRLMERAYEATIQNPAVIATLAAEDQDAALTVFEEVFMASVEAEFKADTARFASYFGNKELMKRVILSYLERNY